MVFVAPEPVVVKTPGVLVNVQVPVAGNPLKITLPVAVEHVGWVIVPIPGVAGVLKVVTKTSNLDVLSQLFIVWLA